jgi:hypothetical protein
MIYYGRELLFLGQRNWGVGRSCILYAKGHPGASGRRLRLQYRLRRMEERLGAHQFVHGRRQCGGDVILTTKSGAGFSVARHGVERAFAANETSIDHALTH